MAHAELLQPFILQWEGGFVNDPLDKGGATNKGITIGTFRQFYGKDSTVEQLKHITDTQWCTSSNLGIGTGGGPPNQQSIGCQHPVDWVWASGVHGIKIPQRALGVVADGIVGPKTIAALNAQEPAAFFARIHDERIRFVEDIVRRNPTQARFLKGWKNRINDIKFRA